MDISIVSNPKDSPVNVRNPKHIHEVKKVLGKTIAASGNDTSIYNWDVSAYTFLIIVARTDAAHAHRINIGWKHPDSLGSMAPDNNVFTSSDLRDGESDWIPNKGTNCNVVIYNDDSSNSHVYDLVLYGVN